jgi:O-antigen/teichoic acid export membrane protein
MFVKNPGISRSVLWNHIGRVSEYALFFASTVIIARGLGVGSNGQLAGFLSIVQLLVVLSAAGIEVSLNKYLPQDGGPNPGTRYLITRLLLLRLGLFVAVGTIVVFVLPRVLPAANSVLFEFLGLIILLGLLRSTAPVFGMLLVARFRTGQSALIGVAARAAELAALLWIGASLSITMALVVLIAGTGIQVAGYAVASKVEWTGASRRIPLLPVVTFGAIFWLNTIVDYFLGRQGDVMFLSLLLPETTSASLYDVAYSIVQIGLLVLTVGFGGVSLAALSRYAATDRSRMNALYVVVVRVTSLLTIPVLTFLMICAPDLLHLVYSSRYAGAADVLRIIIGLRIVSRLFATGENADYLLALGKVWTVVRIGIVAACVTVTLHLILIPRWGAIGAAYSGGTGVLLANMLGGITVVRMGGIALQWRAWARTVVAAFLAAIPSLFVPATDVIILHVVISAVVFFVAFVFLLALVRPLHREDFDAIRSALGSVARPLQLFVESR